MSLVARYQDHSRALLALGLPLVGSQLAQVAINVTDTLMMGWYGVEALAALVLATNLFFFLFLFATGFSWAVMPLVASASEAGDEVRVRRVTRMGLWLSVVVFVVFLPVFWFSGPILKALGQDPELSVMAQQYLRIMAFGMLPALGVMVLRSYLSGLERTRVQFRIIVGGAIINIFLNYVLIFGNFGAPELGIRGAAIASTSVNFGSFFALCIYALRQFPDHDLFVRVWKPDWTAFGEVFRMGWQIGVTTVSEVALFNFSAILMGWIGTVALAAHGVALQIATVTFMVQIGLSQAATVRAGRALGRKDGVALRDGAHAALGMGIGFAFVAMALFFAVPDMLVGAFVDPDDPLRDEILDVGRVLLAMAGLFQVADSAQVIGIALLRGLKDTRMPMIFAAISYWVIGAPVSYVLGITLGFNGVGIWLGLVFGLSVAGVLFYIRFRRLTVAL